MGESVQTGRSCDLFVSGVYRSGPTVLATALTAVGAGGTTAAGIFTPRPESAHERQSESAIMNEGRGPVDGSDERVEVGQTGAVHG